MITGHFGLAAGAKSTGPSAPLWSFMLATMWLDVVCAALYLAVVETLDTPPRGGYGTPIIHADYTHSLLGALILSAGFGGFGAWRWDRRVGLVLGGVAFSHWVLNLVVHRADLPLLPGNAGGLPLLGYGLWRFPVASILLEAALLLRGVLLYWRVADRNRTPVTGKVTPALVRGALLASGIVVLVPDALGI